MKKKFLFGNIFSSFLLLTTSAISINWQNVDQAKANSSNSEAQFCHFNEIKFDHYENYKFYGIKLGYNSENKALDVWAYILNYRDPKSAHYYLVCEYLNHSTTYQFNIGKGLHTFHFIIPMFQHESNFFSMSLALNNYYEWVLHPLDYGKFGYKHLFTWNYQKYARAEHWFFNKANLTHQWINFSSVFLTFDDKTYLEDQNTLWFTMQNIVYNENNYFKPLNNFISLKSAHTKFNLSAISLSDVHLKHDHTFNDLVFSNNSWKQTSSKTYNLFLNGFSKYNPLTKHVEIETSSTQKGIALPWCGDIHSWRLTTAIVIQEGIFNKVLNLTFDLPSLESFANFAKYKLNINNLKSFDFQKATHNSYKLSNLDLKRYANHFTLDDYWHLTHHEN